MTDTTHDSPTAPPLQKLALAVDSHGWEDFPSHLAGTEAAQVLAGWTALWHPRFLTAANEIPHWQRVDQLPDEPQGWLLIVPEFAQEQVSVRERNRFVDRGGQLVIGGSDRNKITDQILQANRWPSKADESMVKDCFALGYCYLQVQLMTRQLRYSSTLDESAFRSAVLDAMACIDRPDPADFRDQIQKCFDQLLEERSRYFPSTAKLIDLVYLTPETINSRLKHQLNQKVPFTLQASGETIDLIAAEPELAKTITNRFEANEIAIAGGEFRELENILLSTWSSLRQFQRGQQAFKNLLGQPASVFARRRFGLRVGLPGLLEHFGIGSVIHCTLDEGVFPQSSANQIRWEGLDGTASNALMSPPKLTTDPSGFLNLGVHTGEIIDINQDATQLFVHWPDQGCVYWHDLLRSFEFGPVLGQFVTATQFFEEFIDPGFTQSYVSDDYREPYLAQLVTSKHRNPLSRYSAYWHQLVELMGQCGRWALSQAQQRTGSNPDFLDSLDQINASLDTADSGAFAESESVSPTSDERVLEPATDSDGWRISNPFSFRRRFFLPIPHLDPTHSAVLFQDSQGAVLELPGMSIAQIPRVSEATVVSPSNQPKLVEEVFLRNEFFEIEIDERTGGIGAIKQHGKRTNLLAQQIVARQIAPTRSRNGRQEASVTRMVADECRVTCDSALRGEITARGRLLKNQKSFASFVQTTSVVRGLPTIEVKIEISDLRVPEGDPWQNYVACRFAWKEESCRFYAWQNDSRQRLSRSRMVSPLALEVDQGDVPTAILPDGRPWFQRIGLRQLDSLMVVPGETQREFRFGIGVDLPYPYQTALSQMAAVQAQPDHSAEGSNGSVGWVFHLNRKNVVVLYWLPTQDGKGLRILLKETEGRRVDLVFQSSRTFSTAVTKKLNGERLRELEVQDGKVAFTISAHELIELTIFW